MNYIKLYARVTFKEHSRCSETEVLSLKMLLVSAINVTKKIFTVNMFSCTYILCTESTYLSNIKLYEFKTKDN